AGTMVVGSAVYGLVPRGAGAELWAQRRHGTSDAATPTDTRCMNVPAEFMAEAREIRRLPPWVPGARKTPHGSVEVRPAGRQGAAHPDRRMREIIARRDICATLGRTIVAPRSSICKMEIRVGTP